MAAGIHKSEALTKAEAAVKEFAQAGLAGGNLKCAVGKVEALTTDHDATSIIKMCRIPSNAIIHEVLLSCDALSSGAADIGLYYPQPSKLGGDVSTGTNVAGVIAVDKDCFATAQALGSALNRSNVMFEAAAANIDKAEVMAWEYGGLATDPAGELDVCLTITIVPGAAGTVVLHVYYTDGR